jgi:hypothetical protein
MTKQQGFGTILIVAFVLLLVWLLEKGSSFLHESVTSNIVTPQNTITPDPVTGCPRFDSSIPATVPAAYSAPGAQIVCPISPASGGANCYPPDPASCSCPMGWTLWNDAHTGAYMCLQNS